MPIRWVLLLPYSQRSIKANKTKQNISVLKYAKHSNYFQHVLNRVLVGIINTGEEGNTHQFLALQELVWALHLGIKGRAVTLTWGFRILPIKVLILDDQSVTTLTKLPTIFRHWYHNFSALFASWTNKSQTTNLKK